jgi:hypothetical protein
MSQNVIRKLLRILPLCAGVLAVIEIILINQYAGSGAQIYALESTVSSLRKENNILEQRVASASSLITIGAKVKDMGFVEPEKSQYLTIAPDELPVALYNPQ